MLWLASRRNNADRPFQLDLQMLYGTIVRSGPTEVFRFPPTAVMSFPHLPRILSSTLTEPLGQWSIGEFERGVTKTDASTAAGLPNLARM